MIKRGMGGGAKPRYPSLMFSVIDFFLWPSRPAPAIPASRVPEDTPPPLPPPSRSPFFSFIIYYVYRDRLFVFVLRSAPFRSVPFLLFFSSTIVSLWCACRYRSFYSVIFIFTCLFPFIRIAPSLRLVQKYVLRHKNDTM